MCTDCNCYSNAGALALESLHRQVLPFLLRRLKEDVLADLPPKIVQDYYCELSPLQSQLYEDFARSQAGQIVTQSIGEDSRGEEDGLDREVKVEVKHEETGVEGQDDGGGASGGRRGSVHVFQVGLTYIYLL